MINILFGFSFALVTASVVIIGDFLIKLTADDGKSIWSGYVLTGCLLYAVSAIFWFYAVRHVTLAQAGVAYSMLTLLALCGIGAIWFDEQMFLREYLGIACALAAMVLMVRVTA
jgi:undecaprenyl phosphate-alpha-L-ara4N flippase subunit ArnF